jgi:hypothetical protein
VLGFRFLNFLWLRYLFDLFLLNNWSLNYNGFLIFLLDLLLRWPTLYLLIFSFICLLILLFIFLLLLLFIFLLLFLTLLFFILSFLLNLRWRLFLLDFCLDLIMWLLLSFLFLLFFWLILWLLYCLLVILLLLWLFCLRVIFFTSSSSFFILNFRHIILLYF